MFLESFNFIKTKNKKPEDKNHSDSEFISKSERIKNIRENIDIEDIIEGNENLIFQNEKSVQGLVDLVLNLEKENDIASYDTIFSDDASGRLIALFLKEIIDKKKELINKDKDSSEIFFISGGRHNDDQIKDAVKDFITSKKDQTNKALLVTEIIDTGRSIEDLVSVFIKEGIDFNVASLSVGEGRYLTERTRERLISGDLDFKVAAQFFHRQPGYSGVNKANSSKIDEKFRAHPVVYEHANRDAVKEAREELKLTADRLFNKVYKEADLDDNDN